MKSALGIHQHRARWLAAIVSATVLLSTTASPPVAAAAVTAASNPLLKDRSVPVRELAAEVPTFPTLQSFSAAAAKWPVAGSAAVKLPQAGRAPTAVNIGGLPVKVGPAQTAGSNASSSATTITPSEVQVEVLPNAVAKQADYAVLLRISRADGHQDSGRIRLEVDYSAFRNAYGGDWDNRLTMIGLPSCAAATPLAARCAQATPLTAANHHKLGLLSADVELVAGQRLKDSRKLATLEGVSDQDASGMGEVVVGIAAAAASDTGDYTKTDFHPNYSWVAGSSSGDFSLTYLMQVPPVPGSLSPQVSLGYSSGAVDGQTVGVNVQPFWGEGWNYSPGYVERSYRACKDETANSPKYTITTADNCWRLPNARMVLGGKSVELVLGNDGKWRADNDDAAKVELLTGGTETYYWNDEHWKVSTPDGNTYYFGRSRLPGWTAGDRETASVLGIPVFSNHNGDPCLDAQGTGWTNSWCMMAYRWNLDYVVDRNGNTMSYWYSKETNKTARAGNVSTVSTYDRFSTLSRIEYGTRAGTGATREPAPTATPPARVQFVTGNRCFTAACATHDRTNWPDTPFDLECTGTSCANNGVPSFWSTRRISQIATEIWSGSGIAYNRVDEWALGGAFPAGPYGSNTLWQTMITHTGKVGGSITLPATNFYGITMQQRADYDPSGTMANPYKFRIQRVRSETGGQIEVTYNGQDSGCKFGTPFPDPDNNAKRCFPRYWTNPTGTSGFAWWHKYTVSKVLEKDLVGGSPDKETAYTYTLDGAASSSGSVVLWGGDKGAQVFSSSSGYRSWADWRGYSTVVTTVGTVSGQQSQTKSLYFRGLHGDWTDSGYYARVATVVNSLGESTNDEPQYAGLVHEMQVLDGPGGQVLSKSITNLSRYLTGTRDMTSSWAIPPTQWSYIARNTRERTLTWLPTSSSWRTSEKLTNWNTTYGVIDSVDDLGDTTNGADNICVRNFYTFPAAGAPYLVAYPNRIQTVGVACTATPSYPGDAVSEMRTFYDNAAAYTVAPVKGNATRVDGAVTYTGSTPNLITTQTTGYDLWGRIVSAKNGLGHEGITVYTHIGGLVSSIKMINPLGHDGIRTLDRSRGLPLTTTDPNLKVTTGQYDALGRLLKVWQPGHLTSGTPDAEYQYTLQQGAPSFIRTRKLGPNGNQIDSYEVFDGLLRLRQTQSTAPDGKRVIDDVQYDKRGLEAKKSLFYNNASAPTSTLYTVDAAADALIDQQRRYVYDQTGRRVADELWSRNVFQFKTTNIYQGDRTAIVPPATGTVTQDLFDARGRMTQKRVYHSSDLGGAFDNTGYQYNKAGRLAAVTDPADNQWSYEYDLLGRQTTRVDPDSGTATTVYDNGGRITSTKDGRGQLTFFEYDNLGRKLVQRVDSASGPITASWVYDTVAEGQVTSTTRRDASGDYTLTVSSYDDSYQPLSTTYAVPGFGAGGAALNYTVAHTYKTDGSPATTALPAVGGLPAETLSYGYADSGVTTTLSSGQATYVASSTYTYDGKIAQQVLGAAGMQVRVTSILDAATRRPTAIKTETETATVGTFAEKHVSDYAYDAAGNVTGAGTFVNGTRDQFECFRYDYQLRLTEAWTQADNTGCATPQKAGADPYWRTWSLDTIGNRTQQIDKNADGSAGTTWTYNVGAGHGVKAHQVKSVTAVGPLSGTPTRSFGYDPAGNTLTRTTDTGIAQTLTWDKEGHLESATEGAATTSYVYDPAGNRLLAKTPTKTTLYLPDGTELEKLTSDGSLSGTRYLGGVAVRNSGGLKWTVTNHQGSSVLQIDAVTLVVTVRRFLPFGEARGVQPTWLGTKGYVGGTKDDTGLTHLGAREYDPSLGRFISVDPVMDLGSPRQWHGYAYSGNSPITFSDPSGLAETIDSEGTKAGKGLSGHDAVVSSYGLYIWVINLLKGLKGKATVDIGKSGRKANTIKGASGNKAGNDGRADIIYWGDDVVYVWEVKPGNAYGRTEGRKDLARYISFLQKQLQASGDPRPVRPGGQLPAMYIPSSEGWMRAWTEEGAPGMIFYGRSTPPSAPPPVTVPEPLPVPAPEPGPEPRPVTVPRVTTPTVPVTPGTPTRMLHPWDVPGFGCGGKSGAALTICQGGSFGVAIAIVAVVFGSVFFPEITIPAIGIEGTRQLVTS